MRAPNGEHYSQNFHDNIAVATNDNNPPWTSSSSLLSYTFVNVALTGGSKRQWFQQYKRKLVNVYVKTIYACLKIYFGRHDIESQAAAHRNCLSSTLHKFPLTIRATVQVGVHDVHLGSPESQSPVVLVHISHRKWD